jgi:glycosyltransferase involved in cell wall biosynthesis
MMGYLGSALRRRDNSPPLVILDTRGPHHIALAPLHFARALCRIVWLTATRRMGVLHVNLASRGSVMRKIVVVGLARALGIPYFIHLHGADFVGFFASVPSLFQGMIRWMFRGADATVVLGEAWRRFAVETLGVAPERIRVIYNGAPEPLRLNAPNTDELPIILFLGRVDPTKGMPEILEALARPEVLARPWRLGAAGIGDLAAFGARAAALGLGDRVTFTGWVGREAVEDLIVSATFLLLPSHMEGLPVAVIEAHAHGLPVIASPVGSTAEIVRDGETGLLVAPGDVDALAAAIIRMLDEPDLRRHLAAGARRLFRARLDAEIVAAEFADLYATVGRWS